MPVGQPAEVIKCVAVLYRVVRNFVVVCPEEIKPAAKPAFNNHVQFFSFVDHAIFVMPPKNERHYFVRQFHFILQQGCVPGAPPVRTSTSVVRVDVREGVPVPVPKFRVVPKTFEPGKHFTYVREKRLVVGWWTPPCPF